MRLFAFVALAIGASGCVDAALAQTPPRPADASSRASASPFGTLEESGMANLSLTRGMNGSDRMLGPIGLRGYRGDAGVSLGDRIGQASHGSSGPGSRSGQGYAPGVGSGAPPRPPAPRLESRTQVVSGDVTLPVARRAMMRLAPDVSRCFQRAALPASSPAVHVLLRLEWAPNAQSPRVTEARGENPAITACVESLARTARLGPSPARSRSVVMHAVEWASR